MKKIFMITALMLLAITGCKKENNGVDYKTLIVGEWHCTFSDYNTDIYVAFCSDSSFDLYQKVGEGRHRHYTGSWLTDGTTLSGTYADGTEWGSTYTITFNEDDTMTLTALNGSKEIMTYARESIPNDIVEGSIDVQSVSRTDANYPIL